jgi:hypothetical protein
MARLVYHLNYLASAVHGTTWALSEYLATGMLNNYGPLARTGQMATRDSISCRRVWDRQKRDHAARINHAHSYDVEMHQHPFETASV